jgi:hypothetical protein
MRLARKSKCRDGVVDQPVYPESISAGDLPLQQNNLLAPPLDCHQWLLVTHECGELSPFVAAVCIRTTSSHTDRPNVSSSM